MTEQTSGAVAGSWAVCEPQDGTGMVRIEDRLDTGIRRRCGRR